MHKQIKIFNYFNEVNELMQHQVLKRGVKLSLNARILPYKTLPGLMFVSSILLISIYSPGAIIVCRSKPDYDYLLGNSQLQAEIKILPDQWGVPHIQASHLNDAWFALGFDVARDR